jgi:hypothetical protein
MNNVGLISFVRSQEYRIPDASPPFAPTVTINSGSSGKNMPPEVGLTFGNINDPESGIQKIEYMIEKASSPRSLSYSRVKGWTSNGTNRTKMFLYSQYNLQSGQSVRISVRTVNNDGVVSEVVSRIHTLN